MSSSLYPESEFYQISGYRAHSNGWFKMYDDKPMIDAIIRTKSELLRPGGPDSPVELILGILPSGASYLLMTSDQMFDFTHKHRLAIPRKRKPWLAADFLSLSPIYFDSYKELADKIATYKQRPRNKNRRELEEPQDNSQANRGYVKTGLGVVHYRGYFEQQRTLYRLLTKELAPGKVGMAPPPWLDRVRVVSLVLGEWIVDNRVRGDRLKEPRLVDAGWTDVLLPSYFEQLAGPAVHLKLSGGRKNPGAKGPYFSEAVKPEDDLEGLYSRLRSLFDHDSKNGVPLIVLVHDEEMARGILSRAGIDVDAWSSGLSNLLALAPVRTRHNPERETLPPTTLPGPCIVDTQKLVKTVMETPNPGQTVPHCAKVLHMQTGTPTCAGDDSLLQLRMWTSMAEGPAVDEQHEQRLSHRPECEQVLAPPQQKRPPVEVDPDDSDADPNDTLPEPAPRVAPTIEDDFSDDDW